MKVSKSGFNAYDAADSNLIFNSGQDVFKIVLSGTTTLTVPDPFTSQALLTATIPHGLSTSPAVLVYGQTPYNWVGGGGTMLTNLPITVWHFNASSAGGVDLLSIAQVDSTNLYIRIQNLWSSSVSGLGGTWTFKYYILQETAN